MLELSKTLRINDPLKLHTLKRKLCALAEVYVFEIEFGIPQHEAAKAGVLYKDKIKWLRKNIIGPASLLSENISGENVPWLSLFPNLSVRSAYPAFYTIKQHLQELVEWSAALERSIEEYSRRRTGKVAPAGRPITDLKYALAYDLVEIYAEATERSPSLINHKAFDNDRAQRASGSTLAFIRLATQLVLGDPSAQMLDETRVAIKKYKAAPR
jgi:hypothetical protein